MVLFSLLWLGQVLCWVCFLVGDVLPKHPTEYVTDQYEVVYT
jgi:hypothetical protein